MRAIKKIILILLVTNIIVGCSNEEDVVKPNYTIEILTSDVSLEAGSVGYIEFRISPFENLEINGVKDEDCVFKLKAATGILEPELFELEEIEQKYNEEGLPVKGEYKATIRDLGRYNNYDKNVKLVATLGDGYEYSSPAFRVRYVCDEITRTLLDTGLTLVKIETQDNEEPACEYVYPPEGCWGAGIKNATKVSGKMVIMKDTCIIYNSGDYEKGNTGITIKIRGNTSAHYNKKPFKIKLQSKADLLFRIGDTKYDDKDWLLLKYDGLKSVAGFKINELIGLEWTPSYKFVNLMINGDYRGIYMLCESVEREKYRVNIDKTGYIIEYDPYWWNEDVYFDGGPALQMNYTFKYPDEDDITTEQIDYIKSYIDNLETTLKEGGAYSEYIDVDSWANWLLAHDILGTWDAAGANIFLTKYDNSNMSLLKMGNLWDFDTIYRNSDDFSSIHTSASWIFYYPVLFASEDRTFTNTYKANWLKVMDALFDEMDSYLSAFGKSEYASQIDKSIIYENQRWEESQWKSVPVEIELSRSWFSSRKSFLNGKIQEI